VHGKGAAPPPRAEPCYWPLPHRPTSLALAQVREALRLASGGLAATEDDGRGCRPEPPRRLRSASPPLQALNDHAVHLVCVCLLYDSSCVCTALARRAR